ncbi:cyclopropane-fatty-acyl-phospholipid synthase [Saccharopolyspora kobensis]|uniref:Cyclopropane-fatty-acyl-phospholipid synthase n=1 Tax=Saccharopolyspora kobensis TaxID=146035 RepID=A0A1H6CBK1_9PSEU|nr:cyclopropane-fatty-acyl-phospholipid synthase family protein [Saccharopolyspora kobensis]SEG70314.1 cyclopropane-fatty-acyl-phospholipid synthase [Saccharopolyspora kobensis]SFC34698.1 cyclopropane-fatty-acyl-phospholipid synthase [Saccharopolyspora kobensis]
MGWAEVFARVLGGGAPVEIRAFDGSRTGPPGAEIGVEVRSPLALSHLAAAPGELGLARAYVTGALEVHGDMYTALAAFPSVALHDIPPGLRRELLVKLAGYRLWWPVKPPAVEHRPSGGWRHSKRRDSKAISYHYDVSNRFYEWVLGPSMAYTCAVYPTAESTLEEAQFAKHDLVARKLGLREGMRLLDVGCGWGGMVMHAAEHYGVRALGVTLSRQQAQWAQKAIAERGLADLAEVRHLDYRDVPETGFDAVSSIGLTEHIGLAQLPSYFSFLHDKLVPGGRLLNHCITRPDGSFGARPGKFITRYVFPDGELEPVGTLVSAMNDNGFEVRHEENLREHYALTLAGWCENLEAHWDDAVAEVGLERARVWRLYMAACRLGFERNIVQLHQVLGVRLDDTDAHYPLRPSW